MKEKIDEIGGRKVLVFLLCAALAIVSSLFMRYDYYTEFLKFIIISSGVFFLGNGIEHISDAFGKKNK